MMIIIIIINWDELQHFGHKLALAYCAVCEEVYGIR